MGVTWSRMGKESQQIIPEWLLIKEQSVDYGSQQLQYKAMGLE